MTPWCLYFHCSTFKKELSFIILYGMGTIVSLSQWHCDIAFLCVVSIGMWISNYVNRCMYSLGQTNASTPIAQSIDYWRLNLLLIISFNKMHLSTILAIETSAYCFIRRLCVCVFSLSLLSISWKCRDMQTKCLKWNDRALWLVSVNFFFSKQKKTSLERFDRDAALVIWTLLCAF